MLKFMYVVAVFLFFVVFFITCYFSYSIYLELITQGRESFDWVSYSGILPPMILSIGLFIGLLTFKMHSQHKDMELDREESMFFFKECANKFEEIIELIEITSSSGYDQPTFFNKSCILRNATEIDILLKDINILSKNIKTDSYFFAYDSRKSDLKRKIYIALNSLHVSDYISLLWGDSSDSLDERIKSLNNQVLKSRAETVSNPDFEFQEFTLQKYDSTPFPNGVPVDTLMSIIEFFDGSSGTFNYDELSVLKEYIKFCDEYTNNNGILIKAS